MINKKDENKNIKHASTSNRGTEKRGLGSPNMDAGKKHEIHSKGGHASHSGDRKSHNED